MGSEAKHAPTWTVHRGANAKLACNNEVIAEFVRFTDYRDATEAASILNSHADLVAACKAALAQYIVGPNKTLAMGAPMDVVDALRAALAKAGEA